MAAVSDDCFLAFAMPNPALCRLDSSAAGCAQTPPPRPSPVEGEGVIYRSSIELPPPPLWGRVGMGGMAGLGSSDQCHGIEALPCPGDQALGGGARLGGHGAAREHA